MNYLVVVAHPDDEVLGAGATIHKLTRQGHRVDVAIMCAEVNARAYRPEDDALEQDMKKSLSLLGVNKRYEGVFPNIRMNNVDHIELVQFIENAIIQTQPDVIITHHCSDTNNDHMHTSLACQAAARLFQRRPDVNPLAELWFMEVLSSTDWVVNSSFNRFTPNTYVEIGKEGVKAKIDALAAYRGVMRPFPHSRSEEAIQALAVQRGAEAGLYYAEAFECALRRIG